MTSVMLHSSSAFFASVETGVQSLARRDISHAYNMDSMGP